MTEVADLPIPDDAEGLLEFLDSDAFAAIGNDPADLAEFVAKASAAQTAANADIAEQAAIEKQRVMGKMLIENGVDLDRPEVIGDVKRALGQPPASYNTTRKERFTAAYNPAAPGAALDEVFDTSGDYFQSIWHNAGNVGRDDLVDKLARLADVQNSYTSQIGSDGGFLIPEQLRAQLLSVPLGQDIVRSRATVLPMATSRMPIPTIDETSRETHVFGGVVAYWTEEQAAAVESGAKFGQVALESKTLTGYTEVPNETMMDAMFFGAFFDQTFPRAMAHFGDLAYISGSGVGEPLGFLNSDAMVIVEKEAGQAADTIVWANITKMYSRMLPSSISNGVWVASHDAFPALAEVQSPSGVGIWMGEGSGQDAPPARILGRPLITTDKVPQLGDLGDLAFVDLSYYLIGDRQMMTATSSPHFKFRDRKTAFLITERVDGRPWLESPITPVNGSVNTLSAFVKLAERA